MRGLVERELDPGEKILWIDQPIPKFWNAGSIAMFLFAIPFTAFSIFWMGGVAWITSQDSNAPAGINFFSCFGLPFLLVGLGMLSSPIWMYRAAKKTIYAITDKRAISIVGGRMMKVRSFQPEQLKNLERIERSNGSGSIIIEYETFTTSKGRTRNRPHGFMEIRDVKRVEDFLEDLARKTAS